MRGSKQIITATISKVENILVADIKPIHNTNYKPRIINKIDDMMFEGDVVEGYIYESNNRDYPEINFYVTKNLTRSLDKKEFIRLVTLIVIDRVNDEVSLFDRSKTFVEYDRIKERMRIREYVICRYIAIGMIIEFLNRQVSDTYLGEVFGVNRCTVIHANKELAKYGFTNQLKSIVADIRVKVNDLYEAMKQPQKVEVFEFIPQ